MTANRSRLLVFVKLLFQIVATVAVLAIIVIAVVLYPVFLNARSERATASAIREIEQFIRSNEGKWPSDSSELAKRYPPEGVVSIDFSKTSAEILENPDLLREAIQPKSGVFYTFPGFKGRDRLLTALRETNEVDP